MFLNGNNQIKFKVGFDKDGNRYDIMGKDLINSVELHKEPTLNENAGYSITVDADGDLVSTLSASNYINGVVFVDGSSNANGIYSGSAPLKDRAVIGTPNIETIKIGGYDSNIFKLYDSDFDEILVDVDGKSGKNIYAVMSTDLTDGSTIVDSRIQATFVYINDLGVITQYTGITAGTYTFQPKAVYSFGFARKFNLGLSGDIHNQGDSSVEEIIESVKSSFPVSGIISIEFTSDIAMAQGAYGVNVTFNKDGSAPVVTITDSLGVSFDASRQIVITQNGATIPFFDGIDTYNGNAKISKSKIELKLNGLDVNSDDVSLVGSLTSCSVSIDKVDNKDFIGPIDLGDRFNISFESTL